MPSDAHNSVVNALRQNAALGSEKEFDLAEARAGLEAMTAATVVAEGAEFESISAAGVPSGSSVHSASAPSALQNWPSLSPPTQTKLSLGPGSSKPSRHSPLPIWS